LSHNDSTARTGSFEIILEEHAAPAKMGYGCDPYDTIPSVRHPGSTARQKDLRRLSEWIRTKKHVQDLKQEDTPPAASGEALDVPKLHRTR
jgi:hypothetical protein